MRKIVDLPEPFGPTSPIFSPRNADIDASRKRTCWPWRLETESRRITRGKVAGPTRRGNGAPRIEIREPIPLGRRMDGLLGPYRVLDLTNERGLLCGQILGDLGADVVQVEPPGGSSARRIGPFYEDRPDPDRSLFWW